MNIKNILLVGYLVFGSIHSVQAKEQQVTTKILDWSYRIPYEVPTTAFKNSKKCGNIEMNLPNNSYFNLGYLIIKTNTKHHQTPTDKWFGEGIQISLNCTTKNVQMNPKDSSNFIYNPQKQQWVWKNDGSSEGIYQIKAKNGIGWLIEDEPESIMGTKGSNGDDYIRSIGFCITNNAHTKQLCGAGNVQYIPHKKDIDKNIGNYTGTIYKILQTTKFLDDK
ncbi:hypothetical protein [Commensalibacter oyaizuii]|uniref:Uncharacterized protein n=1 Tax=Commensalibacter oyaizuii TaxID=3043873 RepID=A0ABT6Q422_9PROT|nr:hypothetical protein [Commensalibacter sp. TBRC 16381]MDI2091853.1 hypothetical protein [Commensalibacter sp. TBRC 16381]